MFIAEFLICLTTGQCVVFRESAPVRFQTEQVCLAHAEAKLPELAKATGYKYAIIRCVKTKGESV